MAVFIVALLFFTIHGVDAQARDRWEDLTVTPERLIGLLDLDDIVRGGCGGPVARARARAFSAPTQNSAHIGTLFMRDDADACGLMLEGVRGDKEEVPTLESGYEIPAAISVPTESLAVGMVFIKRLLR